MTELVTLDEAKADLRIDDDASDADVTLKVKIATGIVLEHIKVEAPDWDDETVPGSVKAAILLVTRSLFDDETADPLSPIVRILLTGRRDPTIA